MDTRGNQRLVLRWDRVFRTWIQAGDYRGPYRRLLPCRGCGKQALITNWTKELCPICKETHWLAVAAGIWKVQRRAHAAVNKAIAAGDLHSLDGSVACIDCGAVATCYDHRYYSKPLDVQPVCKSCNKTRGHALDVAPLWKECRLRRQRRRYLSSLMKSV